jgi:flagellar biosynthesis/type III secretory pathway chaperone
MENEQVDLNNLTKEDFMAMAEYVAHTEAINNKLLEELREAKSSLMATVQQRNSLNARLQNIMNDRVNTIDINNVTSVPISTNIELINPEQYREKKNQR